MLTMFRQQCGFNDDLLRIQYCRNIPVGISSKIKHGKEEIRHLRT